MTRGYLEDQAATPENCGMISSPYAYLRVTPRRIQAWREENELAEREVMRDGHWLG